MARKELWDRKGVDTVQVLHSHDFDHPDQVVLETVQDVEPILDQVAQLRDLGGKTPGGMVHTARVPLIIYEKAVREGWVNDSAAWDRWLNDPDNAAFRVWQGRV